MTTHYEEVDEVAIWRDHYNATCVTAERLRAENARLRAAYAKMCTVVHEFIGGFDTAETAREKLRAKFDTQEHPQTK